ncbi:MAG: PhzF family phenazine biosynthesis protein [Bryobacteraceae bacterium]
MGIRITQVDAFTDHPFAGNPAAVCILTEAPADQWMHDVAREMNLSETAFLVPQGDDYNLRWFTPAAEVDLCGHATLASAHVLWEDGHLADDAEARFHTRSGLLSARRCGDWIQMDFPAKLEQPAEPPADLAPALGVNPVYVGRNQFDYLVEIESASELRAIQPDHTRLRKLPVRGVIVTARSDSPEFDFQSRFFAPGVGVDEDPVTGSAHCCLGPYWSKRLGKADFMAYQASPRGGVVKVTCRADRVHLGGQAVTIVRGELIG